MRRVAVILCGSGYRDGSEIREAVGVLWALAKQGASAVCFALDKPQYDVVNCLNGEAMADQTRNQRVESARIARGEVESLADLKVEEFDALILPGGFGAAKNLCTFALEGTQGKVEPEVQRVLTGFRMAGKPIGAVCIAPVIIAMAFPGEGLELTLGADGEAADAIGQLGHRHVPTAANEWHVDLEHKIVTTPAYMHASAPLDAIFDGIAGAVRSLLTF